MINHSVGRLLLDPDFRILSHGIGHPVTSYLVDWTGEFQTPIPLRQMWLKVSQINFVLNGNV